MAYNYGNLVNVITNETKLVTQPDIVADFFLLYVSGTPIREAARTCGIKEVTAKALPFALVSTIAVVITAYIPEIALTLPKLLGY